MKPQIMSFSIRSSEPGGDIPVYRETMWSDNLFRVSNPFSINLPRCKHRRSKRGWRGVAKPIQNALEPPLPRQENYRFSEKVEDPRKTMFSVIHWIHTWGPSLPFI